jgi:hypothetical protein
MPAIHALVVFCGDTLLDQQVVLVGNGRIIDVLGRSLPPSSMASRCATSYTRQVRS